MPEEQGLHLRRTNAAPGEARRFTASTLLGWGWPASIPRVELITSELVMNALQHATGDIELRLELHGERARLRVSVCDESPQVKPVRGGLPDEHGGFGLNIVDTLATSWGVDVGGDHKRVWADLDLI